MSIRQEVMYGEGAGKNVGTADRVVRAAGAIVALVCAVVAPLPLAVRVLALGGVGVYLTATVFFGRCLGYRVLGRSTCSVGSRSSPAGRP
jgi:hypothetical protein